MLTGHSLANRAGALLAVDPHVCEILQREERELVGMTFDTLTHPDDRKRNVAAVASLSPQDSPLTIRKRYLRPDGSAVWSNVQVSVLRGSDGDRLIGTIQLVNPDSLKRGPESLWRSAKRVIAFIQRRRLELGDDLCSDYGWIILLQVYLAEAEGRTLKVAEISDVSSTRLSLVTRWLLVLEQKMLVERTPWTNLSPQLTALGVEKVETLLEANTDYWGDTAVGSTCNASSK